MSVSSVMENQETPADALFWAASRALGIKDKDLTDMQVAKVAATIAKEDMPAPGDDESRDEFGD